MGEPGPGYTVPPVAYRHQVQTKLETDYPEGSKYANGTYFGA